jgi:N-acetylglutamate synthase-like GNAT family acetyltransferase
LETLDLDLLQEYRNGSFVISTDPTRLDLELIYDFLTNRSYWAQGRPKQVVARSIRHSLNFGLYDGSKQIGLARVISDYATYAYLADVFVLEEYRGHSLGKWLIECVTSHPALQGLRRWTLATRDAHGLYSQYGFTPLVAPERWMEKFNQ